MRKFSNGVDLTVHRYQSAQRGVVTKVSEHVLPGAGIGRPSTGPGAFPVDIPESSRLCIIRDTTADVRSGDWVTFPEGHRLSGSWWKVRGEVMEAISPFSGWQAGVTFRIERDHNPEVPS